MADDDNDGDLIPDVADLNEEFEEGEAEAEAEAQAQAEDGSEPVLREVAKESRALQFLTTHHPECRLDYIETVFEKLPLKSYPANYGSDKNHTSVPYLTLFEKTKILGFRANQLAQGARPLVEFHKSITDVLDIARLELEQKRLPFIIKRPMPDGTFEYFRLSDLILI